MTDRPEAVTAEDVRGLRVETARLADSLATVKDAVAVKADAAEVIEAKRLAKRANINSTLAGIALAVAALIGGLLWNAERMRHDHDAKVTHDRRVADCQSVADFGDLVKQGATAIVTTPDKQAQLDAFIAKYDASIDTGVAKVRVKKGYSADCTVIGNPPKPGDK